MVKIEYKIEFFEDDDPATIPYEYNDTIYGDIIIYINNSVYSHMSSVLDYWINKLFEAVECLKSNSDFTIKEIENSWDYLNFKKQDEQVTISWLSDEAVKWREEIGYDEFAAEVVRVINEFANELCEFDIRFKNSLVVTRLIQRLGNFIKG